jgi:hypothetical protein
MSKIEHRKHQTLASPTQTTPAKNKRRKTITGVEKRTSTAYSSLINWQAKRLEDRPHHHKRILTLNFNIFIFYIRDQFYSEY